MADNYEDDHLKVSSPNSEQPNNHKPSPDQVRPLRVKAFTWDKDSPSIRNYSHTYVNECMPWNYISRPNHFYIKHAKTFYISGFHIWTIIN